MSQAAGRRLFARLAFNALLCNIDPHTVSARHDVHSLAWTRDHYLAIYVKLSRPNLVGREVSSSLKLGPARSSLPCSRMTTTSEGSSSCDLHPFKTELPHAFMCKALRQRVVHTE
jgi:hypothetical protein